MGNVVLEYVLASQLRRLNRVQTKGKELPFTEDAIAQAVERIRAVPFDGLCRTSENKAVVPLLYEGRHVMQDVNQAAVDRMFEAMCAGLNEEQKADLKKKFCSRDELNRLESRLYLIAWDVSQHFEKTWKGSGFKGQLTAQGKKEALLIKKFLDQFGKVSSEVLISGPDDREGEGEDQADENVQKFWKTQMAKHGNEKDYNRNVIGAFKNGDDPEIIIVVDKLLTGFDAPRNVVLYVARTLKEHTLLQAIARVNRLHPAKDFGYTRRRPPV
jgi:type I restriction enzyme R subunit